MRMGWGGLGWAELGWGGGNQLITSREVSRKFSLDVLFMEYFSPESVFVVAIVSGKLIGTSPQTTYSSGLYRYPRRFAHAAVPAKIALTFT